LTAAAVTEYRTKLQGTTVKHAVVDGAAYNGSAIDGINTLAEFIALLGEDTLASQVPGLQPHAADFVDALETTLRGVEFGTIKQVLCFGHWVKNRIIQVQDQESAAFTFLKNLNASLYGADGEPAMRRTALTKRIRELRARAKTSGIQDFDRAIIAASVLLNSTGLPVTRSLIDRAASTVRAAIGDDPNDDDPIEKLVKTMESAFRDKGCWRDTAAQLVAQLNEAKARVIGESTAARTATINQTRWHTSTYLSFVFAEQNLQHLKAFYVSQTSRCQSVTAINEVLKDPVSQKAIEEELKEYVATMEPAASFLNKASENSPGLVLRMYALLVFMRSELLGMPENTVGRKLGNTVDELMNVPFGDTGNNFKATLHFFF
jgi:hypothetical protein